MNMKKRIRKLINLSLAAALMLSLAVPASSELAFAAEEVSYATQENMPQEADAAEVEGDLQADTEEEQTETAVSDEVSETEEEVPSAPELEASSENVQDQADSKITSIEEATISGIEDKDYTGSLLTQNISVSLNGEELTQDEDYTVTYSNNKNVGTAKMTISGIGDYEGSVSETFEIDYPCSVPKITSVYNTDAGVVVKWGKVSDAEKYRVYRRNARGSWERVCDTTSLECVDKKVEFGKQYTYAVRCINTSGTLFASADSSAGKGTTYTVDVGETAVSHVYSDILQFKVRYTKVDHAAGYQVRYALDPEMKNCVVKTFDSNEASLSVSKAPEGIYFVQARAFKKDHAGNIIYGPWSHWRLAKCVKHDIGASEETLEQHVAQATTNEAKRAILYAFARVGYPYSQTYRMTGNYYDCSSLVWYAWNAAGIDLTSDWVGTAAAQAEALQYKTINQSQLTPGALIYFSSGTNGRYKNITHVAMYVGDGMVVEAANSRLGVVYRSLNGRSGVVAYCDPCIKGGWYKESGQWCFYQSGIKQTNKWINNGTGWCWLDANGNRAAGKWLQINNAWYYFNGSGIMVKNTWVKDSAGWCWMTGDGRMAKSQWIKDHGYWYYLNANGHMVTGTQKINGKQYRFDASGRWIS